MRYGPVRPRSGRSCGPIRGSDFWVGLWGRTFGSDFGVRLWGVTHRQYQVSYDKLRHRICHVADQRGKGGHNKQLNSTQDEGLKRYVSYLIRIGQPPNRQGLRLGANRILQASGDTDKGCSAEWATRWMTRNQSWFRTIRAKTLAAERKAVHNIEDFNNHFRDFQCAIVEFGIAQDDIYNMDETGFRIGCLGGRVVITHSSSRVVYLADPEVRDWITAIETISANGKTIPPMLILSGSIMLEKHFDNDLTLFGITHSGYSNAIIGVEYIKHFDKMTAKSTVGKYRMLIFDGAGSYMSDEFTWYCWQNDIIPFRLPAHTTHLLQLLDVGIF